MFDIQKLLCKAGLKLENKICSGFGHRDIWTEIPSLVDILERVIIDENVAVFLTGGMGDFDSKFSSAVRSLQRKYPHIKLVLVKPYFSNELNTNKEYYEQMYDEIIIPDNVVGVHPKSAITKRNRWICEQSDIIVSYIKREYGGAYSAVKYAAKQGKKIIYISENK